jgi:hypothetical protein
MTTARSAATRRLARSVSAALALGLVIVLGFAGLPNARPAVATLDFSPLAKPQRIYDSRSGVTLNAGRVTAIAIPGGGALAVVNLTSTTAQAPGFLTVWACDRARPATSSLAFTASQPATSATAVTPIGSDGRVCIYNSAATHLVVDLFGTSGATSRFQAVAPVRALDTRSTAVRPAAGSVTKVPLAGVAGVDSTTSAVVATLTVTDTAGSGWAAIYPCSQGWSGTSTLNWNGAGASRANAAFTGVGSTATLCVRISSAAHVIVDISARAEPGADLVAMAPQRVVDTRQATGPTGGIPVTAGTVVRVPNILTGSYATAANVTVTGATGSGWARVWLCSQAEPATANVNFAKGADVANAVVAISKPDGPLCLRVSGASAHVVVDSTAMFRQGTPTSMLKDRTKFGAWVAGMVGSPSLLGAREQLLGTRFEVASYFYGYGDQFPAAIERGFADGGGRDVLISWDMGPYRFSDWASGKHDGYLRTIGALAAAYPYPIHLRPWAEMNGDWQPYQPTAGGEQPYGGTPAEFVAAWRHVVDTVRASGGTRIKWVFNPYAATYPTATDIRSIWPGRAHVDVLGMDGYNWGGGPAPWQGFAEIFAGIYSELTALDPTLPVWVCEVGSREPAFDDGAPNIAGRSKEAWVADMFGQRGFSRVAAIAWFDERKERDWRFDSSPGSLAAFRTAL